MNKMIETSKKLKEATHNDRLLLFRIGDFYEAYCEDAQKASEVLGITLTKRNGEDGYYLAGFPYHALDTYLPKLIRAGLRVAICDDISEPAKLATEQDAEDADAEEIKDDEQPQEPQADAQATETKSAKIVYPDKDSEDYTPQHGTTFELEEMQKIVCGYIEIIRLNDDRLMIVNEEGLLQGLPVNI